MNMGQKQINKPLKDKDLTAITYFIRVAGLVLPFLGLLGLYLGYTKRGMSGAVLGFVIAVIGGILLSVFVMYVMNAVGSAAGNILFGRRTAVWTTREKVQGFLSQARFNRNNGDYKAAFEFVNKVLEKDPDYPEALFFKAQILWERFGKAESALQFLEKIIALESEDEAFRNQVENTYRQWSHTESPPANLAVPDGLDIGLKKSGGLFGRRFTELSLDNLKERAEEKPVAEWAIHVSVVFALILILVVALFSWRLEELNDVGETMSRTAQQLAASTQTNADDIRQIEHSLKKIETRINTINHKLKGK